MSVNCFNRIPPESEHDLILQAQKNDRSALDKLISMHMPMIMRLAGKLCTSSCLKDEMVQSGVIGMIRAIRRFDISAATTLMTYAVPWIIGEMRCTMRSMEKHTVLSLQEEKPCGVTLEELLGKEDPRFSHLDLRMAIEQLDKEAQLLILLRFFRDRTQSETALLLGKSQSQISKLEQRTLAKLKSLLC